MPSVRGKAGCLAKTPLSQKQKEGHTLGQLRAAESRVRPMEMGLPAPCTALGQPSNPQSPGVGKEGTCHARGSEMLFVGLIKISMTQIKIQQAVII